MKTISHILLFIGFFLFASCQTYKKTYIHPNDLASINKELPSKEKLETLFLIGDAGSNKNYNSGQQHLFEIIKKEVNEIGENSSISFLGDNIYPAGLPKKDNADRAGAEHRILNQLELTNGEHRSYFIPGNHDWNEMKKGGLKAVKRQEKFIQEYDEKDNVHFYPNHGCGDPVVKKIQKDLYYVFIDTQWWLQNWENEKHINHGCEVKSRQEFLQVLSEIFLKHKNDQIVVMMHHPLFSNGEHGGKFSAKTHFFPLATLNSKLWIPLPILGSIMPLNRSLGAIKQDIPHPLYQELKNGILDLLVQNKNVIFASGHDHTLQYFKEGVNHFLVTGSGSKINYAKRGGDARMVRSAMGFSRVHFYKDKSVWLDFIAVDEDSPEGELIYRKEIIKPKAGTQAIALTYPEGAELPKEIVFAANEKFGGKSFKRLLLGNQYRNMWTTEVEVPIVNLDTQFGGLRPIKKGGGMASNSLRLENPDGDQYILRSIRKDYRKLFGPDMQNLKAINIMTDLNSASHPYGALLLPTLSRAANVYYTKPELVYLKRQKGLGFYNEFFGEEFYLMEDRPTGDRSTFENFGNSSEIISYLDLIDRKRETNEAQVDQIWTVRSRLFDMFIHDWDRHDDQWRWARFEENGDEIYRPIPRDRDQAFYKFDGVIPWFVSHYAVKKFKPFKKTIKDVKWHAFNGRYFDRYFLNELEWSDWETQIEFLQKQLSDEVILASAKDLPKEVYDEYHNEYEEFLISRRGHLKTIGWKLYKYLSKAVDIVGSNEDERFEIERLENGDVKVKVFETSKKGKKKEKIYDRTFIKSETKEIRLYGLGGKDDFKISGKSKKSIKLRVIGGFGSDDLEDNSKVAGLRKLTKAYDEPKGLDIDARSELRDLTGNSLEENEYNRFAHEYNKTICLPIIGYTPDDKLWLGAGFSTVLHGFRKDPYKSKHLYSFSFSPSTRNALHFAYEGDVTGAFFNQLDFQPSFNSDRPYFENYFGLGNDTDLSDEDFDYNSVRQDYYNGHAFIKKAWLDNRFSMFLGPKFASWSVEDEEDRITTDPISGITQDDLDRKNYLGGALGFKIDSKDNVMFPKQGIVTSFDLSVLGKLGDKKHIEKYSAEQIVYLTFGTRFACTLASRTGWTLARGDLQFYQYPALGNNNYLRGFRNFRFRGNQIFYQNIDLRIKLLNWKNNILPMQIGVLGGFDAGRVWLNKVSNGNFHKSYTAGIWFNLLSAIVLQPNMAFSKEERQFNFQIGFKF